MNFASKFKTLAAVALVCAGCDVQDQQADIAPAKPASADAENAQKFSSISLSSTNLNGGTFSGGVLIVSHATGDISVCFDVCHPIGKIEPTKAQDLVLNASGRMGVYLTNTTTGRVVLCQAEFTPFVDRFV